MAESWNVSLRLKELHRHSPVVYFSDPVGSLNRIFRSVTSSVNWQLIAVAARPNVASDPAVHHQRCDDLSRAVWSGIRAQESCHDADVGTLSRRAGPGALIRRKLLLPRVSVHAGPKSGAQVCPTGQKLAAPFTHQVALDRLVDRDALFLRVVRSVGLAVVDRMADRQLLCGGGFDRHNLQTRNVL